MRTTSRFLGSLLATILLGLGACDSPTAPKPFLDCEKVRAIALGDSKSGELNTSDCARSDGSFVDYYRFTLSSSQTVTITMRSGAIDSYLSLYNGAEAFLEQDDDSGGGISGLDAQIVIALSAGDYVIGVNSLDAGEIGAYTLSLSR
jgi:hypothetical protein